MTRVLGLALSIRVASSVLTDHWFHFNLEGWKEARKKVLVFGAHTLFGILYFQIDTILLAFWKGDQDVGIYQAVFRIIVLTLVIVDIATSTCHACIISIPQYRINTLESSRTSAL